MSNQYAFLTRWRVEGTCGEVADVLGDPLELPRWWPSVYLAVEELANSAIDGPAQREIVNLTDKRAGPSRTAQLELLTDLGPIASCPSLPL